MNGTIKWLMIFSLPLSTTLLTYNQSNGPIESVATVKKGNNSIAGFLNPRSAIKKKIIIVEMHTRKNEKYLFVLFFLLEIYNRKIKSIAANNDKMLKILKTLRLIFSITNITC